ncbi:MAG TPA: energy transducer TonB [Gemmatimonadaceae bacterium]|nr:energy transducer TonB [Gemmatimonadaceae bacterium]
MLETLLESRSRRRRSSGGAIVSVAAHTALIAAAVYATAEARMTPRSAIDTVRPVYFPSSAPEAPTPSRKSDAVVDVPNRTPVIESIAVDLPAITEVQLPTTSGSDFPSHMLRGSGTESVGALTVTGVEPYNAEQVEKQVEPAPGNLPPRYPDVLRSAGVEGQVIAQFVVDAAGKVEEGSLRFIRGDNVLFEEAVRRALERMRFVPAEVGGRKVRQLVQMPFVFTLSR